MGGKCVGGKCECTIFGADLPKCTVQKYGSNGQSVQWLTYPGRCVDFASRCPSKSRQSSASDTGCKKGQICCH